MEYLPVTVDKSHLITIGERLYSESIELIRELVNNAYDADATEVDVKMTDELIEVRDNGTGMDRAGLRQYFNIGSPEKTVKSKSPIFHRDLIGQFGIGKFASLSACECFEVYTQKGDFAAKVKRLTPNAVIQRTKFGETGVSVCLDDFGEDGAECFTEGTVIYINQQHPLYQREVKKPDTYILNVTRLITQEISLMKITKNPRQAFLRQSKLLRDAFIDRQCTS